MAEGLEGSLGSAGGGLAAWLAGASVADDGELASIAGTATTVRLHPNPYPHCKPNLRPNHALTLVTLCIFVKMREVSCKNRKMPHF